VTLLTVALLFSRTLELLYVLLFLPFALRRRQRLPQPGARKARKFAILIPAHNEADVIGCLLESVEALTYPKGAYRTFVIADNCTDQTAPVAGIYGCRVLERRDANRRGKAAAIRWALEQPEVEAYEYDALLVLDADNVVTPGFLGLANESIGGGAEACQGSVECKNIGDSWVSIGNYIVYSAMNRIHQRGRQALGLSAQLCGTGQVFTRDLLRRIGWEDASLTEDRYLTYRLLLDGVRVAWLEDAVVYDEKPLRAGDAVRQQSRWISGWLKDFTTFFPQCWSAFRWRPRLATLDGMFNLVRPFFAGREVVVIPLLVVFGGPGLWSWWALLLLTSLAYHAIGLGLNASPARYYKYLLLWPAFRLLAVVAMLRTVISGRNLAWNHTAHTRRMRLSDIPK
jgi:cellulose synthase/poly-beta-1,6-N-acetylglucosamine synthase-like glycosyltransferase